jgi:hypothetical protein
MDLAERERMTGPLHEQRGSALAMKEEILMGMGFPTVKTQIGLDPSMGAVTVGCGVTD